jgi:hypothetical protein
VGRALDSLVTRLTKLLANLNIFRELTATTKDARRFRGQVAEVLPPWPTTLGSRPVVRKPDEGPRLRRSLGFPRARTDDGRLAACRIATSTAGRVARNSPVSVQR